MVPIKIYTTQSCAFCKMAKEYFKSQNWPYEEYDVMSDIEKRQEMVTKSGQLGVPVIDIGGKLIIGFDKGKIDEYHAEASESGRSASAPATA